MRVKNLNKSRDDIVSLRQKISSDLKTLGALCASMGDEIERRYHEEMARSGGDGEGLEDFLTVARILKRDNMAVNGALAIVQGKVQGAAGYDFEEMAEEAAEGKIANG
jgi:hypothetical protein